MFLSRLHALPSVRQLPVIMHVTCIAVQEELESLEYPAVRDFLGWVKHRTSVTFRRLDQPRVRFATHDAVAFVAHNNDFACSISWHI